MYQKFVVQEKSWSRKESKKLFNISRSKYFLKILGTTEFFDTRNLCKLWHLKNVFFHTKVKTISEFVSKNVVSKILGTQDFKGYEKINIPGP